MEHPRPDSTPASCRIIALAALLLLSAPAPSATGGRADRDLPSASPSPPAGIPRGELPLRFERNEGQADSSARFTARCEGFLLFLCEGEAILATGGVSPRDRPGAFPGAAVAPPPELLRMGFSGTGGTLRFEAGALLPGRSHYLLGRDRSRWRRNVQGHASVLARNVAPGVDLLFRGEGRKLAYEFLVAAGADHGGAFLDFGEGTPLAIDPEGSLRVGTARGVLVHSRPVLVQPGPGGERRTPGAFLLRGGGQVGFDVRGRDPALPLRIDPVITLATYHGGGEQEHATGVALDGEEEILVTGWSASVNMPLVEPLQGAHGGGYVDGFLMKLEKGGTVLVFATFLGGDGDDYLYGLSVDASGRAIVAGRSDSTDFPLVAQVQTQKGAGFDGVAARVDPAGDALAWSTYLGGNGDDYLYGAAADGEAALLAGASDSSDFPTTPGSFQEATGGEWDGVLARIPAAGGTLDFATFAGGGDFDGFLGVAVDVSGDVVVVGSTASTDFPVASPYQGAYGGGDFDAVVARFSGDGTSMAWGTFLGGTDLDQASSVALDSDGAPVVAGHTASSGFPVLAAFDGTYGGGGVDGFLAKFAASGASLQFSTFLGGSGGDYAFAVAVGPGTLHVAGVTGSSDFPTFNAPQNAHAGGGLDGFVTRLGADGKALRFSTFLGTSAMDELRGLAVDGAGDEIVAGDTWGGVVSVTNNAPQPVYGGGTFDAVIVKFALSPPEPPPDLAATPLLLGTAPAISLAWSAGGGLATGFEIERRTGPDSFAPVKVLGGSFRTWTDTPLPEKTLFVYRVRAFNLDGPSDWSEEAEATTPAIPSIPATPSGFTAIPVSSTGILCLWTDESGDETGFDLSRESAGEALSPEATLPPGTEEHLVLGLRPDTTYTFHLSATGTGGPSPGTPRATATTFPTLEVVVEKGKISNVPKPLRDRAKASGTWAFLGESPDGLLDPGADGFRIALGGEAEGLFVSVPPGDGGWRERKGTWTWKSPRGQLPKARLTLVPSRGSFRLKVGRANFVHPPSNPVRVSLRCGDDAGTAVAEWDFLRPGLYRMR